MHWRRATKAVGEAVWEILSTLPVISSVECRARRFGWWRRTGSSHSIQLKQRAGRQAGRQPARQQQQIRWYEGRTQRQLSPRSIFDTRCHSLTAHPHIHSSVACADDTRDWCRLTCILTPLVHLCVVRRSAALYTLRSSSRRALSRVSLFFPWFSSLVPSLLNVCSLFLAFVLFSALRVCTGRS